MPICNLSVNSRYAVALTEVYVLASVYFSFLTSGVPHYVKLISIVPGTTKAMQNHLQLLFSVLLSVKLS